MDGWHTTVEIPDGVYYSPPSDGPAEFYALLVRLARELPNGETGWTITHRRPDAQLGAVWATQVFGESFSDS
jgi:hypothetical protein